MHFVQQPGEACDDGNDVDSDDCTNACEYPTCGDGIIWEGMEECEDGNDDNHDSCLNICLKNTCGDGVLWPEVEECDDGNLIDDDGCNAECYRDRVVFVTEELYAIKQFGNLDVTDLFCGQAAQKAGLPNPMRFWAWTSDGESSPSLRFEHTAGRYVLVTGEVIADGWDDLTDGELLHPIDRTADGTLMHEVPVWSGTKPDGTSYPDGHCDGWSTPSDEKVHNGANDLTDEGWTDYVGEFSITCGHALHLYCFEARL